MENFSWSITCPVMDIYWPGMKYSSDGFIVSHNLLHREYTRVFFYDQGLMVGPFPIV